jgi:hypothetical protein
VICIQLLGLFLIPDILLPLLPELVGLFLMAAVCCIYRYCVAWYPVYRVPHGNFRASFLTYHSLGKLVQEMPSPDMSGGQHTRIVCPVVGLQGYNDKVPF